MIDNRCFDRICCPAAKNVWGLASPGNAMGAATNYASPDQKDFSEDKVMYKASRSAKVRFMKSSVECWKTCKVFALWQVCLLSGLLLLSGTGFAQLSTASLSGVVKDSSGAAVPKSKVMLKNVATAADHTTPTNHPGPHPFLPTIPRNSVVSPPPHSLW